MLMKKDKEVRGGEGREGNREQERKREGCV